MSPERSTQRVINGRKKTVQVSMIGDGEPALNFFQFFSIFFFCFPPLSPSLLFNMDRSFLGAGCMHFLGYILIKLNELKNKIPILRGSGASLPPIPHVADPMIS